MSRITLSTFLVFFISFVSAQSGVYRTPALSPDAGRVAFSFQGDIWIMSLKTMEPKRLTLHQAYESNPVFSVDGNSIAFSSTRHGNADVFTMNNNGGELKRLTYHSAGDYLSDWTINNELLFSTRRTYVQVERDQEIHKVKSVGGTPERLLNAVGKMAVASPDGKHIAYVSGACRIEREAYKGPANLDIWIYNVEQGSYRKLTTNNTNDFLPRWKSNSELYFLNGETGHYNIYSQNIDSGEKVAVTNVTDDGIRYFDVAGSTVIYEKQTDLYLLNLEDSKSRKLEIQISADYRFDPVEKKTFSKGVSEYDVSPNAKEVAMVIHREVFVKEIDKEKKRSVNVSNHAFSDVSVAWLNDSTLLFLSDREGNKDLYVLTSDDPKTTSIAKALKHKLEKVTSEKSDIEDLSVSPNKEKVAFTRGGRQLVVADISSSGKLSGEKVLTDSWALPSGISWSPDSRYLAYSQQDLRFNREVFIHLIDGEPVNVSMHPKGDYNAVWSEDGSKLGFVSARGYGGDSDIWFVWLKESDWQKTSEDWKEGSWYDEPVKEPKKKGKKKEDSKDDGEEEKLVEIDFENIHDRLIRVSSMDGSEYGLTISKDGETFYFNARANTEKQADLYSVKWDGKDLKKLTNGGAGLYGLSNDPGSSGFFAIKSGSFVKLDDKGKITNLPHSAKMTIDHDLEKSYVFEEAWKALDKNFYDPDFHGQNWNSLKEKYKPWAMATSTSQDFRYISNWMLGQLNASHMGIYGSNPEKVQSESTGKLGIEVKPLDKGVEVIHVVPQSAAYREQAKIEVGDVILVVNGEELSSENNFYELLEGESGSQIWLEVKTENGDKKDVIIRPKSSLGNILYEEWVAERKKLVDEYSNGKLGYVHIRGMDMRSFERFERELMASGYGKDGIVIDVRYNGGGWTTDYLMAVLNVKQHAYTVPRGATDNLEKNNKDFANFYPYSERLPLAAWTGPSIALCNASSYSNAEIFSHAYKNLGIGTLVGEPTFGAVISTGGIGLLDGSFVRLPFRGWYVKADGTNMENGPAVPDVLVQNSPDYKAQGKDEQLQKAVELLLEQIKGK